MKDIKSNERSLFSIHDPRPIDFEVKRNSLQSMFNAYVYQMWKILNALMLLTG